MKGVDDFAWVLAIAVILVVVFMAAAALYPVLYGSGQPGQNQTPGPGQAPMTLASFQQIGFVGYSSSYAGQSLDYGSFVVGEPQSENIRRAVQLEICSGLWCSRAQELSVSVPAYYMDTLRGAKVSFAVYDTNRYGDLVVKWNGREFHRGRLPSQPFSITIDKQYVKDSNTLQIYADGPGLMFWASTIYTLRDFRVDAEYGPARIESFALSQSELSAWGSGMLGFTGSGGAGQMRIRVNGNAVYQGTPAGQTNVALNFSTARPRVGENLIVFDAPGSGVFSLSNVRLRLDILTNQIVKTRTFQLGAAEYNALGRGMINFTVNSIQREGELGMKLNNRQLSVPRPVVGSNVVYFSKNESAQGANTLEITGSGYWDIGELTISA